MTSPEVIFTISRRIRALPYHIVKSLMSIVGENLLCSPRALWALLGRAVGRPFSSLVRPTRSAILVYCSVRDWTRFLRHRIRKYPNSPVHTLSDSLRIYFFPLWKADLFFSGFAVEFAGCVWTVVVSGNEKLRIRKYPDTCGRGLRSPGQAWRKRDDACKTVCRSLFNHENYAGITVIAVRRTGECTGFIDIIDPPTPRMRRQGLKNPIARPTCFTLF